MTGKGFMETFGHRRWEHHWIVASTNDPSWREKVHEEMQEQGKHHGYELVSVMHKDDTVIAFMKREMKGYG